MFERSPFLFLTLSYDGMIVMASPHWQARIGLSPRELVGLDVRDLVCDEDHEQLSRVLALNMHRRRPVSNVSFRCRGKDDRRLTLRWTLQPDPETRCYYVFAEEPAIARVASDVQQGTPADTHINLNDVLTGVWRADPQGRPLSCSQGLLTLLGIANLDEFNFSLATRLHPDDVLQGKVAWEEARRSGRAQQVRLRFTSPTRGPVVLLASIEQETDAEGKVIGLFGTIADITRLEEIDLRFQTVLMGADLGLWEWDVEQDQGVIDERMASMLGRTVEEIETNIGGWFKLIHPDDIASLTAYMEAFLAGKGDRYDYEYRVRHKDGSWRWLLTRGIATDRNPDGSVRRMIGTIIDISAMRNAEETLRIAADSAELGTWDWRIDTGVVAYSDQWKRILGYQPDEVANHIDEFKRLTHPDDLAASFALIEAHWQGETPFAELRFRMLHRDGSWRWIHSRGRVTEWNADHKPQRMCGTHLDITARVREDQQRMELQHELDKARRIEKIGMLAATIAHDFNNALGPIVAQSELLMQRCADQADVMARLEQIHRAAQRGREMVARIFEVGRRERGETSILRVRDVVRDSVAECQALLPVSARFTINEPDDSVAVEFHVGQLEEVLINLIVNAIHALPQDDGAVTIRTDVVAWGDVAPDSLASGCELDASSQYVCISVQDNGHGIPSEILPRIFESFFTTKGVKGTGIGLPSALEVIKAHKGGISVSSTPGAGTTIKLYVRRVNAPKPSCVAPTRTSKAEAAIGTPAQLRVLVVDDDLSMTEVLSDMLEHLGHESTCCNRAREALKLLESGHDHFDLLLTDYSMPDLSGSELALQAGALHPGLVILMASGYYRDRGIHKLVGKVVDGLVPKPLDLESLRTALAGVPELARAKRSGNQLDAP